MTPFARTSRTTLLIGTAVLILIALAFANFAQKDETGNVTAFVVASVVSIAVAAAMFLFVVPRAEEEARRDNGPAMIGLILGVIAVLLLLAFWSGLPIAIGMPAIALGSLGRSRSDELGLGGAAIAAQVLGTLAVVLDVIACIVG